MKFNKKHKYTANFTDKLLTYVCHDAYTVVMRDSDGMIHTCFTDDASIKAHVDPEETYKDALWAIMVKIKGGKSYSGGVTQLVKDIGSILDKHNLKVVPKDLHETKELR